MNYLPLVVSLSFGLLVTITGCQHTENTTATIIANQSVETTRTPIANAKNIVTGQFDNGLSYVIKKQSAPKHRAKLWLLVKAGSLQEQEHQLGFAHFVEHMAFNGTTDFPKKELVDYIQSVGMKFGQGINANTSYDKTIYKLNIPTSDPAVFESGFKIMANWAHQVSFEPEEVDKERGVILEERRRKDSANYRLTLKHHPVEYKGTRYADRQPIGTLEAIQTVKAEELQRFYKDWYQPQNMTVLAMGDFNPKQVKQLIEKYMAAIPKSQQGKSVKKYLLPDNQQPLVSIATDPQARSTFMVFQIDEHKVPIVTYDDQLQHIKRVIFKNLLNQRLNRAISEGTIPAITAKSEFYSTLGQRLSFRLSVTSKPQLSKQVSELVLAEAYRAAQLGFSDKELQRVKSGLSTLVQSWRSTYKATDRMNSYVDHIMLDEPLYDHHSIADFWLAKQSQITLSEVNAVATDWLERSHNRTVFISAPDSEIASLPSEKGILSLWEKVSKQSYQAYQVDSIPEQLMSEIPKPGTIVDRSYDKQYHSHIWTLSNGAKVVLKKTSFKSDEILFKASRKGGFSQLDDKTYRNSVYSAGYLDYMGVADFSINTLRTFLIDKKIKLSTKFSETKDSLVGSSSSYDIQPFMQLLHLKFSAARKDQQAFKLLTDKQAAAMAKNGNVPAFKFAMAIDHAKNSDNPRFINKYSAETVKMMDLDIIYQNYKSSFANAGEFTFVFVGDINLSQMEKLATTYIATLPSSPKVVQTKQVNIDKRTKGHLEVHLKEGVDKKARVWLENSGPAVWSQKNSLTFEAIKYSLNVLLRDKVREELGGTYTIKVKGALINLPRHEYTLGIEFDCESERVDELVSALRMELQRLMQQGIPATQLDNFKIQYKSRMKNLIRRNSHWAGKLHLLGKNPVFSLEPALYNKAIEEMTVEEVNKALKQYLDAPNSFYATLLPKNSEVKLLINNSTLIN